MSRRRNCALCRPSSPAADPMPTPLPDATDDPAPALAEHTAACLSLHSEAQPHEALAFRPPRHVHRSDQHLLGASTLQEGRHGAIPAGLQWITRSQPPDRCGSHRLNVALRRIAIAPLRIQEPAQAFLACRRAPGKSTREALRETPCGTPLKRAERVCSTRSTLNNGRLWRWRVDIGATHVATVGEARPVSR